MYGENIDLIPVCNLSDVLMVDEIGYSGNLQIYKNRN